MNIYFYSPSLLTNLIKALANKEQRIDQLIAPSEQRNVFQIIDWIFDSLKKCLNISQ